MCPFYQGGPEYSQLIKLSRTSGNRLVRGWRRLHVVVGQYTNLSYQKGGMFELRRKREPENPSN